jgi:hypothetical protein
MKGDTAHSHRERERHEKKRFGHEDEVVEVAHCTIVIMIQLSWAVATCTLCTLMISLETPPLDQTHVIETQTPY